MRENIAVIFGGKSVEHDISVITGLQVLDNLSSRYNVIPIYIQPDGRACTADNLDDAEVYLDFERKVVKKKWVGFMPGRNYILIDGKFKSRTKIDCAVLCTHGRNGEDGTLQGLLEMCQIPYTSPGVLSSSVCMDKAATKIFMQTNEIPTPEFVYFYASDFLKSQETVVSLVEEKLGYPVIVKPANLGSSVGITTCKNSFEMIFAINNALLFDDKIIVEEFIPRAEEYCCAAFRMGNEIITSDVVAVQKSEIFTFKDKYLSEKTSQKQEIDSDLIESIKNLTIKAYLALACDGVVRVDFLFKDNLMVNEINTIPGSLAFNLFKFPFRDLLDALIEEAKVRQSVKAHHNYTFSSDAFEQFAKMQKQNKYTKN